MLLLNNMASVDKERQFIPLSALANLRDEITIFDEHTHTDRSPDGLDHWKKVIAAASDIHLDALANTEHDTVSKQMKMAALAKELGLLLIHGVEITTKYKNIFPHIVLFSKERKALKDLLSYVRFNPADLPLPMLIKAPLYALSVYPVAIALEELLDWLDDNKDTFAIAAHPSTGQPIKRGESLLSYTGKELTSITLTDLEKFIGRIKGIEIINSFPNPQLDQERLAFAIANELIVFGGSDAHEASKIGDVVTWIEGKYKTTEELLKAIKTKPTGTAYRDDLLPSN